MFNLYEDVECMQVPAVAALLLAALSAIPYCGTDADTASTILNGPTATDSQLILNKLYLMLHSAELRNSTEFSNSNYTSPIHGFGFYNDLTSEKTRTDGVDTNIYKVPTVKNRQRKVMSDLRSHMETSTVAMTTPRMMMERRRKPGDTGSSAPLLNYIFDSYSITHHHKIQKAKTGSEIYAAAAPEIEALVGSTAHLDCKVDALHDKLVLMSWVRRKNAEDPMELFYTGTQQYTADDRYSSRFIPPDIWRLEVKEVRPSDAARYDCQMPTHPPRTARLTLRVPG